MTPWSLTLPDDALVMRGGICRVTDLEKGVLVAIKKFGRPGLSIWAAEVPDPVDLLLSSGIPHPQIRITTVGRLRAAGFTEFEQTLDPPHYSVWLEERRWLEQLEIFRDAFDEPVTKASLQRVTSDLDLS